MSQSDNPSSLIPHPSSLRLVFMGTPASAVPTLRRCLEDGHEVAAVWTQPDRPSGRGNKLSAPPVKEFALARGLTVHQPSKIKTEEARELFTYGQSFEGAQYTVYKKTRGRWLKRQEFYVYRCAY